jgi:hypothetical protein
VLDGAKRVIEMQERLLEAKRQEQLEILRLMAMQDEQDAKELQILYAMAPQTLAYLRARVLRWLQAIPLGADPWELG